MVFFIFTYAKDFQPLMYEIIDHQTDYYDNIEMTCFIHSFDIGNSRYIVNYYYLIPFYLLCTQNNDQLYNVQSISTFATLLFRCVVFLINNNYYISAQTHSKIISYKWIEKKIHGRSIKEDYQIELGDDALNVINSHVVICTCRYTRPNIKHVFLYPLYKTIAIKPRIMI